MSNVKYANDNMTESYQSFVSKDKIKEWREARMRALHKIEMMVAIAHGRISDDDAETNRGVTEHPDGDDNQRQPSQIRDCLRELALLCQNNPNAQ